jgi:hypothetical protein
MINPSSSAFVSEQMMDPKPQKKTKQKQKQKTSLFFPYSPRTLLSSPNSRTPRWGATLLRRARARARKNSRGFPFRPSFLRFRSFPVETGIPTYRPPYLPTYLPYLHTYLLTMRIVLFFDDFYSFGWKNGPYKDENRLFIILPTTS